MALKFIFNPFPSNPFKISSSSSPTRTLVFSFNPNSSSSSFPRKHISAKIPARDRVIHFGKHKGQMLGTLPSDYLRWVSKNLITEDSKEWGKLADEVLEDPVYKDRIEWEFAEAVMTGDRGGIRRTEDPHDRLIEISEKFGWDFDDRIGWGRVNFALLGTSKGGRLPRKGSSSEVSQIGKMGSLSEESKVGRGRKSGFLSKRGSKVPVVDADEVMEDRVRGSREERRERRRLKRGLQLHKVKVEISGMKNKEEDEDEDDQDEDLNVESSTPSKLFPGRESLLKKALINRKKLELMTKETDNVAIVDHAFGRLPDHLLIEIFIRVPVSDWVHISCVKQQWANLFRGECLWQSALIRMWPLADPRKRWPGPIPRGLSKRRYTALYVSKHLFSFDGEIDEIMGHTYLFLKEQLELPAMAPPSGILHGTIIDQFIACGKSRDKAHELATQIWLAVIDNLEENDHTFLLLKRFGQEGDIFLPYPYSRSYKVQWRIFEKLFTDFRDCFNRVDYYDVLACAKYRFQPIPSAWLGY